MAYKKLKNAVLELPAKAIQALYVFYSLCFEIATIAVSRRQRTRPHAARQETDNVTSRLNGFFTSWSLCDSGSFIDPKRQGVY
jgi:hypothetical protein